MTQNTLASWNFYKGWEVYQEHLVRAIEPLTAEQLELKISPLNWPASPAYRTHTRWLVVYHDGRRWSRRRSHRPMGV